MGRLSNDHEDLLNQRKNSHKPHGEMGNPVSNLFNGIFQVNGNWDKQHDQNFPMKGKPL